MEEPLLERLDHVTPSQKSEGKGWVKGTPFNNASSADQELKPLDRMAESRSYMCRLERMGNRCPSIQA